MNRELRENELARRPAWMKGAEVVKWVGETAILSSAAIFLKIPASAFWKPFFAPAKEFIGTTAGKIFPQAQKYAQMQVQPTYAALLSGELKAVKETVTTGARAAKEAALNRMTQEEALYVPDSLPPEAKDFLRSIHRSLHLPAQINEFSRRVSTRENNFRAQGLEQSLEDPAVWSTIRVRAYTESYRAAFLEKDSLASGIINAAIRDIEQKGKTYNAETLAALATMIIELDNPIKTVPVNVVSQTGEAVAGSITGTWQIYKAYRKGFKDMKPNDLDAAFRQLKNGSMGALAMIGAWYAYQNIGGSKVSGSIYDNPDKKRDKNLPAEGQVRVGGITLPALGFHNETWAAAQMVASYRHLLDSQYGKETVALNYDDILRAALGPMKDVPGIKQTFVLQLAETKEPLKTLSQWTASRMVPAGVAQIARWMDTPGDLDIDTFFKQPTKRFPTNFKEELEVRIPGLRQDVSKFKRDPSTTYRK